MNERIKELIEQASVRGEVYLPGDDGHPSPTFYFDKVKFAELIVRECARVAIQQQTQNDIDGNVSKNPGKEFAYALIEHFGVEE